MKKGKLYQIQTAFTTGFGSFLMGSLNVWPSYTTTMYTSNSTTPLTTVMTKSEEALLGSLPSLGAMVGTGLVGLALNHLARKHGGILICLPYVLSWSIIGVTTSINVLLAARFLAGVAGGAFLVYAPIYISEVTEASIRGALANVPMFLYCLGVFLSYIFGWFLSHRTIIWANLSISVFCLGLHILLKESPIFLLRENKDEEARAAIAHYRGCSVNSLEVVEEFSRLKQAIMPAVELVAVNEDDSTKDGEPEKEKLNIESVPTEAVKKMPAIKLLFVSPATRKAFTVVLIVITMQVFMGIVPVQVYAKTVFEQADPNGANLYSVIFAAVLIAGTIVTSGVADKAGRRILIIASSGLVAVTMTALGVLLQTKMGPPLMTVAVIMAYCFSFMSGAGSVPYILLAEVFIPEVQSIASMLVIEWVWFLNFFIIAVFPYVTNGIGIHGAFYVFACSGVANAIMAYFILPETKGLSNEQIQEKLLNRKKN